MVITFIDDDLKDFCSTGKSKKSAYKKYVKDKAFISALIDVLSTLAFVSEAKSLSKYSYLHYEKLTANRSGQSSVRIMNGRPERLIFIEKSEGIEIVVLELNTTHYGNKK